MPAPIVRDEAWLRRGSDEQPGGCWLWRSAKPGRYGHTTIRGVTVDVHRIAYAVMVGPIPDGMMVLHTCDTPACVNPAHLFTGTGSDNMRDAAQKGRLVPPPSELCSQPGEANGRAKLTAADVETIRADGNKYSQRSQARRFKVSPLTIRLILRGERWQATPGTGAASAE